VFNEGTVLSGWVIEIFVLFLWAKLVLVYTLSENKNFKGGVADDQN
jgi:hypothetical protein